MMKRDLLLMKCHFFCFMGALGPILPFISVVGKQLGISETVVGMIFGVLPFVYFLAKPIFGFLIDYFVNLRPFIFSLTIGLMCTSFLIMYCLQPAKTVMELTTHNVTCLPESFCNINNDSSNWKVSKMCGLECENYLMENIQLDMDASNCSHMDHSCANMSSNCVVKCSDKQSSIFVFQDLSDKSTFSIFMVLACFGCVCFNVLNSASDAICFSVMGEGNEMMYGPQRVWGTVGYGFTAFISGYFTDYLSDGLHVKSNTPSFVLLMLFTFLDIIVCSLMKFPKLQSKIVAKDVLNVIFQSHVVVFLFFALMIGFMDGFLAYYLFWYMEDIANVTGYFNQIRLIEGLTVLVQSFVGETIVFIYSGKIIEYLGFGRSLSLCFFCFSVRLLLLSVVPNPWWVLPIECVFFGLTYGLSYAAIVAYVGIVSDPKMHGLMLGICTGMYDGVGYGVGSIVGSLISEAIGMRTTFKVFALVSLICGILQYMAYKYVVIPHFHKGKLVPQDENAEKEVEIDLDDTSSKLTSSHS